MTEAVEVVAPPVDKRSRLGYSLKPLALGVLGAVALLIWDAYRHTSVKFRVSIDLGPVQAPSATVDGKPFVSGRWVAPGHRKIVVSAAEADPVEREFFLWLGPHDIEDFQLHRSRGGVTIEVTPTPLEVILKGEFATNSVKSDVAKFDSLPVGPHRSRLAQISGRLFPADCLVQFSLLYPHRLPRKTTLRMGRVSRAPPHLA